MRFSPGCSCCGGTPPEVTSCETNFTVGSTITLNRGGGTDADELYIAVIVYDSAGPRSLSILPPNWVELHHISVPGPFAISGKTYKAWVGYLKPSVGEPSSWTWIFLGSGSTLGYVTGIIGADIPSASSSNTGTSTVYTALSVACGASTLNISSWVWEVHLGVGTTLAEDSDSNIMQIDCGISTITECVNFSFLRTSSPSPPSTGDNTLTVVSLSGPSDKWAAFNVVIDPF